MHKNLMMIFHYLVFWLSSIFLPMLIWFIKDRNFEPLFFSIIFVLGFIPAWLTACYSNAVKQKAWSKSHKLYKFLWMLQSILIGGFVSFIYAELFFLVFARRFDLYGGSSIAIYGMVCAGLSCMILLMTEWCWLKWVIYGKSKNI